MIYCNRRIILPLVRSYADISTRTLSPGITRILWTRILPLKCPIISCPVSNWTRNWVFGRVSVTSPSTSTVFGLGRSLICYESKMPASHTIQGIEHLSSEERCASARSRVAQIKHIVYAQKYPVKGSWRHFIAIYLRIVEYRCVFGFRGCFAPRMAINSFQLPVLLVAQGGNSWLLLCYGLRACL